MDESDEKQCRMIIPSIGYDKFRTPPPIPGDKYLYVNYSYKIEHILYIDEEESFIRLTFNMDKSWCDSSLTFQNLKKDQINSIFLDDKNIIWSPWITDKNVRNVDMSIRADDEEIFKVVPNTEFNFKYNSKTNSHNALLFEV